MTMVNRRIGVDGPINDIAIDLLLNDTSAK